MAGATLPDQVLALMPALQHVSNGAGKIALLADGTVMGFVHMVFLLMFAAAIAFFAPSTQEMSNKRRLCVGAVLMPLLLQAVFFGGHVEFLYFQF
jgi:hypothetical protein